MDYFSNEQMQIVLQLTVAVLLGSIIGIERTLANRLAGFRTFALVSLGACAFTIVSNLAFAMFGQGTAFDPSRIASQIVVGVGFLAGGLIIFNKDQVHGLTTSAGIWVAAAIGMAVGFQMYTVAFTLTVLTLLIFGLFWKIEQKIVEHRRDR